jgi:hypothetical protein
MRIERLVHFGDRAPVRPSNSSDAPVEKLIAIHDHSLPLMLALAHLDPTLKITDHRLEVLDELQLLRADSRNNAVKADVMLRTLWNGSERTRIRTKLPLQPCNAVKAWHLPVQMAGGVVEAEADTAGKLGEKNVPAAPTAPRTLEPRKCPVIISPHH